MFRAGRQAFILAFVLGGMLVLPATADQFFNPCQDDLQGDGDPTLPPSQACGEPLPTPLHAGGGGVPHPPASSTATSAASNVWESLTSSASDAKLPSDLQPEDTDAPSSNASFGPDGPPQEFVSPPPFIASGLGPGPPNPLLPYVLAASLAPLVHCGGAPSGPGEALGTALPISNAQFVAPAAQETPCGDEAVSSPGQASAPPVASTLALAPAPDPRVAWVAAVLGASAVLAGLAVVCYSRLRADGALKNAMRHQILDHVTKHPGVDTSLVARTLGLSRRAARHHVDVLLSFGRLKAHRVGGRNCLYPAHLGDPARLTAIALLNRGSVQALHRILVREPGLSQTELGRKLGITQQSVSALVRRMAEVGLVVPERNGRNVAYRLPRDDRPDALRLPG